MADEYTPTPATRAGAGVMKRADVQAELGPILSDAVTYADSILSPEREKATKYYNGEPFGNEEDGRSQAILTIVRDTISGITPDLQKLFFGPERVVEFLPKSRESVVGARVATDYVHYNFVERNNGFLESLAVLKDGLIRKIGVFKSWWDESSDVRAYTLRNVTEDELTAIAADSKIKLLGVKKTGDTNTVHITKSMPGRVRVKSLKPEEFIYNRSASDTETGFVILGHRMRKTRGELIAMGITEKVIDEHGGDDGTLATNVEELARRPAGDSTQDEDGGGEANAMNAYKEVYGHLDVDGDGIAELRQFCTLGPGDYVTNGDGLGEPVDEHPFAIFIPDPEPHTLHGGSWADRTMDLQLTMSSVLRAQLDSLAASIFSRMGYIEGQANVNDILNTEIGAPIRMRSQNAVQPFVIPFSGEAASPILEYLAQTVEQRTGRKRGAEGLDMDGLQSTTEKGVNAALAGAQSQTEMLARVFAEMTLKPLFRRMYRLIQQNQPVEFVKLRDQMVEVDPSGWDAELDVSVNVALGSMNTERKIALIGDILQKQEQIVAVLGLDNPVVPLPLHVATLQRGVELGGFRDVDSFFKSLPPDWKPPQAPPQPNPEMMLVQIEQAKAQASAQMDAAKQQQSQAQAAADADLENRKLQQQYVIEQQKMQMALEIKRMELEAETNSKIQTAQADAAVAATTERARIEAENQRTATKLSMEDARARDEMALAHQRETEAMRLEHERATQEAGHKAAQAQRDSEQKHEERKLAATEKAKPEPKPEAPKLPDIHIHTGGNKKVVRDGKGLVVGTENAE